MKEKEGEKARGRGGGLKDKGVCVLDVFKVLSREELCW